MTESRQASDRRLDILQVRSPAWIQTTEEVMPISPAQWEAAAEERLSAVSRPVLAFLKANYMAYSAEELAAELHLDTELT